MQTARRNSLHRAASYQIRKDLLESAPPITRLVDCRHICGKGAVLSVNIVKLASGPSLSCTRACVCTCVRETNALQGWATESVGAERKFLGNVMTAGKHMCSASLSAFYRNIWQFCETCKLEGGACLATSVKNTEIFCFVFSVTL